MLDLNAVRPTLTVAGSVVAFTVSLIKVVKAASVPLAPISPIATGSHSCVFVKQEWYGVWPTKRNQSFQREMRFNDEDVLGKITSGAPAYTAIK